MICPKCHDAGSISRPYMMGLRDGDIYTITLCDCGAGRRAGLAMRQQQREAQYKQARLARIGEEGKT